MDDGDRYRIQQAAEAQRFADRAINQADKEAWHRIAQAWLSLVTDPDGDAQERNEPVLGKKSRQS
jgi:hypothetical protein